MRFKIFTYFPSKVHFEKRPILSIVKLVAHILKTLESEEVICNALFDENTIRRVVRKTA